MPRKKKRNILIRCHQDLYSCLDCDYKTESEKAIELHQKYSHGREKRREGAYYRCINCSKSFNTDENLLKHMKREHRM